MLLGDVALRIAELLSNFGVVRRVLVLEILRSFLHLLSQLGEALARDVLGNKAVECVDGPGFVIQTTPNGPVGANVLIQKIDEILFRASPWIQDGLFSALGEELDCGKSSDALLLRRCLGILCLGINLGDYDI
jgi:hypothetical protein